MIGRKPYQVGHIFIMLLLIVLFSAMVNMNKGNIAIISYGAGLSKCNMTFNDILDCYEVRDDYCMRNNFTEYPYMFLSNCSNGLKVGGYISEKFDVKDVDFRVSIATLFQFDCETRIVKNEN